MFSLFKKRSKHTNVLPLQADMHSHLLPGLDDGVQTLSEAVQLVRQMSELGYKQLVTTPHILSDFYPNTPNGIRKQLKALREACQQEGIEMRLEAAAEYYLDEVFFKSLQTDEDLLTFGAQKYILFETGFVNQPAILLDAIFRMKAKGLQPILAHPERYEYMAQHRELAQELVERGALLQLNLNSLSGYYSIPAKKIGEWLIDKKLVHFVGTDCHNQKHMNLLKESVKAPYFDKLLKLDLLNNTLLEA
ncbi:tyrosine-protein phosphatase [Cesiribacter andamanensis]|uniref:protein-tyrosine-phosphatase n=1 Tax=Cesiribacter andamanensis AMV16 TaxID=1279009 RepID=M7N6J1_9BACT|nr:CpsB/CapC family capsule biosynthesis tyrosine phosphatase [Cesiribacter andamanensis]EMR02836.1 Tyrosine-protein phosphatase YwqE [Cesiribacter andamanensis AMV16]